MLPRRLLAATAILLLTTLYFGIALAKPQPVQLLAADEEDIFVGNRNPYDFGYEFGDGLGARQYRKEMSDGNGIVEGSYGYVGLDGLYRNVQYKADSKGYRAVVKSNEPGLANQNTADATFVVEPPPAGVLVKDFVLLADDAKAGVQDGVLPERKAPLLASEVK